MNLAERLEKARAARKPKKVKAAPKVKKAPKRRRGRRQRVSESFQTTRPIPAGKDESDEESRPDRQRWRKCRHLQGGCGKSFCRLDRLHQHHSRQGEKISIVGFSTWKVSSRKARKGKNIRAPGKKSRSPPESARCSRPGTTLKTKVNKKKKIVRRMPPCSGGASLHHRDQAWRGAPRSRRRTRRVRSTGPGHPDTFRTSEALPTGIPP